MSGRDSKDLERIFDELVACSRLHFANEEQFLDQAGYSGAVAHKQEHEKKIKQILVLQVRFSDAKESAGYLEVLDQLKDWLFVHIESSDKEFMAHLKATGVDSILAAWDEPK
jgi:hemerythrin